MIFFCIIMLIFLLIAFQVKHFLADFILQTPYQYTNKGKFLHLGGILHAFIHGFFTSIIALCVNDDVIYILSLGLLDMFLHYTIDLIKTQFTQKRQYATTIMSNVVIKSNKYFVALGLDQLAHQLCYIFFVFCLIY